MILYDLYWFIYIDLLICWPNVLQFAVLNGISSSGWSLGIIPQKGEIKTPRIDPTKKYLTTGIFGWIWNIAQTLLPMNHNEPTEGTLLRIYPSMFRGATGATWPRHHARGCRTHHRDTAWTWNSSSSSQHGWTWGRTGWQGRAYFTFAHFESLCSSFEKMRYHEN